MSDIERVMTGAAQRLLAALSPGDLPDARLPFGGPARAEWSYLPGSRRGAELARLSPAGRKAAYRLLATALSRPAFAQAVTIMAFEELLDLEEQEELRRHNDGYYVALFGTPGGEAWGWRFEGHHLSVNVTVVGGQPVVAPLFLGSNPARVLDDGDLVAAPLLREEALARDLVTSLPPALRNRAVIAGNAPSDIVTAMAASTGSALEPAGVTVAELPGDARDLLCRLLRVYTGRLAPGLADTGLADTGLAGMGPGDTGPGDTGRDRIGDAETTFAWAGGLRPGDGHYYRIQGPGLLIEYDNTQRDGNHAHSVLRRPGADFGSSLLASHLAGERP
ncbi:MAG TPA: DUF3500 domain-containing protein [Trebonia sp.]|nr:DUF3500 domain-containing protein [Trebonia sp.]